jgi:long-chain-fatty-acid--[acyl-carrier-protein] ligase
MLLEGYGITECSPVVTVNAIGDSKNGVGIPLKGTELLIVSLEELAPLPQGERWMVLVKGPNIFGGYINPGLASPFVSVHDEKWYLTGDLGYLNSDGALILSGRLKRFIKMGGEMLSLAAIEEALHKAFFASKEKLEEGTPLAVCAKEEAGEKTKIFVFATVNLNIDEVNRKLKEAGFSNLVRIYKVQHMDSIPLMGSGKVNYRALESMIPSLSE